MLKSGKYEAIVDDTVMENYHITIEVKETDKSYIFKMIENINHYGPDHFELLFKKSDRFVLRKDRPGHTMRVWDDRSFAIYPFQAGIPFYFQRVDSTPLSFLGEWIDFNRIVTAMTDRCKLFECLGCKFADRGVMPSEVEKHCIDHAKEGECIFYTKHMQKFNGEIRRITIKGEEL